MVDIGNVANKLTLLTGNCSILSDKSCIARGADNMCNLYCIVDNAPKLVRSYNEFREINNKYNSFRCNTPLYGICDNMGNELRAPTYYRVGASKGDLVIVDDLSMALGLLDISNNKYILDCNYDEIGLYEDFDYILTSTEHGNICEIFDNTGKKALHGRYKNIIITEEIVICRVGMLGEHGITKIYDLKLNEIDTENAVVKLSRDIHTLELDVDINEIHEEKTRLSFRKLKYMQPISEKEGSVV